MRGASFAAFGIAFAVTFAAAFVAGLHLAGAPLPGPADFAACVVGHGEGSACGVVEHALLTLPFLGAGGLALWAAACPDARWGRRAVVGLLLAPLPWGLYHLATRDAQASGPWIGVAQVVAAAGLAAAGYALAHEGRSGAAPA